MMADSWGPWIEHDGKVFPEALVGNYFQATLLLSATDELGGAPCLTRDLEGWCTENERKNPNWYSEYFGQIWTYTAGPDVGRDFSVALVLSYRIRKPKGMQVVTDMLRPLAKPFLERVE